MTRVGGGKRMEVEVGRWRQGGGSGKWGTVLAKGSGLQESGGGKSMVVVRRGTFSRGRWGSIARRWWWQHDGGG